MSHSLIIGVITDDQTNSSASKIEIITPITVDSERKFYFVDGINSKLFIPRTYFLTNSKKAYSVLTSLAKENTSIAENLANDSYSSVNRVYEQPNCHGAALMPAIDGVAYDKPTLISNKRTLAYSERIHQCDLDTLRSGLALDLTNTGIDLDDLSQVHSKVTFWLNRTVYAHCDKKADKVAIFLDGKMIGSNMPLLSEYAKKLQDNIQQKLAKQAQAKAAKMSQKAKSAYKEKVAEIKSSLSLNDLVADTVWSANFFDLI